MLFCKYIFEYISNSIVFYSNIYLTEIKKENSSNFFLIIVNENLTYLKFEQLSNLLFRLYCIQERLDACSWNRLG